MDDMICDSDCDGIIAVALLKSEAEKFILESVIIYESSDDYKYDDE